MRNNPTIESRKRLQNSLWGLFIGDALAMPAHWYYQVDNIEKKDQTISVEVKDFTIDEIGLNFAGDVAITSFSPLGLEGGLRFKQNVCGPPYGPQLSLYQVVLTVKVV